MTDEAPRPYVSHIDRRTTLAWLGATGAAAATSAFARRAKAATAATPIARGYGTDPVLTKPASAPWPRTLTPAQLQTAAILCDFILPASGAAPSASSLGVPDFIDEWVSAPYPEQKADRPVILAGLAWVEDEARKRHGVDLMHAAPADRTALLTSLTTWPSDPAMRAPFTAFRRFRTLTIGAYYTTQPGFKDIGYIGNVARTSDPGPSPEVKAHLDRELKKLGL